MIWPTPGGAFEGVNLCANIHSNHTTGQYKATSNKIIFPCPRNHKGPRVGIYEKLSYTTVCNVLCHGTVWKGFLLF